MLQLAQEVYALYAANKMTVVAFTGWFVHVNWPYLKYNGGVLGSAKYYVTTFLFGAAPSQKAAKQYASSVPDTTP